MVRPGLLVLIASCSFTPPASDGDGGMDSRTADGGGDAFSDGNIVGATATFDASKFVSAGGVATVSWTHTASGTSRLVVVAVSQTNSGSAVTAVTYGGAAMTLLGTKINTTKSIAISMFKLVAPPTGPQPVVMAFAGTVTVVAGSISFTSVDQITPTGSFVSAAGGDPPPSPSVTVPSAKTDLVMDTIVVDTNPSNITPGALQTERWNTSNNMWAAASTKPGEEASTATSWTENGSPDDWAMGAVSIHGGN